MRRLFGCPDIVSLTDKFLMARNFFRIFTENNPVMGYSKTFFIPEAKGLRQLYFETSRPLSYHANRLPHVHVPRTDTGLYLFTVCTQLPDAKSSSPTKQS